MKYTKEFKLNMLKKRKNGEDTIIVLDHKFYGTRSALMRI